MARRDTIAGPEVAKEVLSGLSCHLLHSSSSSNQTHEKFPSPPCFAAFDRPASSSSPMAANHRRRSVTLEDAWLQNNDSIATGVDVQQHSASSPCSPRHIDTTSRSLSPTNPLVSPRSLEIKLGCESVIKHRDLIVYPVEKRGLSGESIKFFPALEDRPFVEVISMKRGGVFEDFRKLVARTVATWSKDHFVRDIVVQLMWSEYMVLVTHWTRCVAQFTWKPRYFDASANRKNPLVKIECTPDSFEDIANTVMFSDILTNEWRQNRTHEYTWVLRPSVCV